MSMYENDPNRPPVRDPIDPNRPRVRDTYVNPSAGGWAVAIVAFLFVVILAFAFWPSGERTSTQLSERQPTTERPATPSASKPTAPTNPSPPK